MQRLTEIVLVVSPILDLNEVNAARGKSWSRRSRRNRRVPNRIV